MTGADWLNMHDAGVRLRIRVQPRASKTQVAGVHGDALRIRIAAPPVDGEANQALIRFLARTVGVAQSQVRLTSGAGGRTKIIDIEGTSIAHVRNALLP